MRFLSLALLLVLLTGCSINWRKFMGQPMGSSLTMRKDRDPVGFRGVPNLVMVENSVWRGGQPNEAGWHFLENLGVTSVVKLNTEGEGSDEYAVWAEWPVHRFPITFEQQMLGNGVAQAVSNAVAAIKPGTFVHCSHGEDRTGVVIATYRVQTGWPKARAEKEMMAHGFHRLLHGLHEYWENFVVAPSDPMW